MNFWFNISKALKGPSYKFKIDIVKRKGNVNKSIKKKAVVTNVKFIRQQKVFGKGGKTVIKKKTNMLLRTIRLYFFTGIVQNLPPLSTLLSIYNINVQKLSEELTFFFKNNFLEGVPVILLIDIFKDCSYKFFFLGFRFNFLLQTVCYNTILTKRTSLFLYFNTLKFFFDLDLWFLLFIKYFSCKQSIFFFESFLKNIKSTCQVLGIAKIKRVNLVNESSTD